VLSFVFREGAYDACIDSRALRVLVLSFRLVSDFTPPVFTIQPPGQTWRGGPNQYPGYPATNDNATKLFEGRGQNHVAALTYNAGANRNYAVREPLRDSLLPEFRGPTGSSDKTYYEARFAEPFECPFFFCIKWTQFGGTGDSMDSSSEL